MAYSSSNGNLSGRLLSNHKLLSKLSPREQACLAPLLHHVTLPLREVLFGFEEDIKYCYFPLNGVVSLTAGMTDGHVSEVGVVGSEGFVGSPIALGESRSANEAIVQVGPCDALRISAFDLRSALSDNPVFNRLLLRYVNVQLVMTAQSSACNALHLAESRLARWLLMVQDRVENDTFNITHEFLAAMIATRRATVTDVIGKLEQAGIIQHSRSKLHILSREKLEQVSCECYGHMQRYVTRLLKASSENSKESQQD